MPFNGAGVYTLPAGNPVVTGTVISSTVQNNTMSDVATALTDCVTRDGQSPPTTNLPMGGFRITGLGNAAARTDAVTAGQIQDGGLTTLSTVAGSDTITASDAPLITAYVAGQSFDFIAVGSNATSAVTLNINSLGAKAITKNGKTQLSPGDIVTGQVVRVLYDGTQFQITSPASVSSSPTFRNKLINGDFSIWNRGTSFSASGGTLVYCADKWAFTAASGGTAAVGQALTTAGDPLAGSKFAAQFNQTVAATGGASPGFLQRIESASTFQGQVATIYLVARASAPLTISPIVTQNFGTGGSPSANSAVNFPAIAVTTGETLFTVSAAIPATTGKTFGSNGDDYLQLSFVMPTGSTFTVVYYAAMLVQGASADSFEKLPPEIQNALCQRYFTTIPVLALTTANTFSQSLPVEMRGTPAISQTLNTGSGATYAALQNTLTGRSTQAVFQNAANSSLGTATLRLDSDY